GSCCPSLLPSCPTRRSSDLTLAFGSDWFVAPMEPLMGIYAAVTRRTLDGANPDGWVPEQKISVAEAVRAYTAGSAYAEGQEARRSEEHTSELQSREKPVCRR